MTRLTTLMTAALALLLVAGCAQAPPADEASGEAFEQLRERYMEAETAEEKADMAREYLEQHPDTEHSAGVADAYLYHRSHELEQPQEAWDFVASVRDRAEDPEVRFSLGMTLAEYAEEASRTIDLESVVAELAAERELRFTERADVVEAAVDREQWGLAVDQAEAGLAQATPEAYLADYPDRDFTREEAEQRARHRKAMMLAPLGWAQYQLGRVEEGMDSFRRADAFTETNYVGVPQTPLNVYRGRAELQRGNAERAMELLAVDAVFGDREDARDALRQAWAAARGDEGSFEEWLWSERQRLARRVDDVTLPRYDGQEFSLASLEDKVVLLAFWFPT